jgi:hypothetical protein
MVADEHDDGVPWLREARDAYSGPLLDGLDDVVGLYVDLN